MTVARWSTQTAQCRQIPPDFKYDNIKLNEGKIQITSQQSKRIGKLESKLPIKSEFPKSQIDKPCPQSQNYIVPIPIEPLSSLKQQISKNLTLQPPSNLILNHTIHPQAKLIIQNNSFEFLFAIKISFWVGSFAFWDLKLRSGAQP